MKSKLLVVDGLDMPSAIGEQHQGVGAGLPGSLVGRDRPPVKQRVAGAVEGLHEQRALVGSQARAFHPVSVRRDDRIDPPPRSGSIVR